MANDPEKAAYYEKKIQEHFDSLTATEMFLASHNLRMTSSGVTIHEDGIVTYYLSSEETPEYKTKVEADHKAKREKAKERQESIEHSREAADVRRRIQEEIYHRRSIEAALNEHMLGTGIFASGDTPESMIAALSNLLWLRLRWIKVRKLIAGLLPVKRIPLYINQKDNPPPSGGGRSFSQVPDSSPVPAGLRSNLIYNEQIAKKFARLTVWYKLSKVRRLTYRGSARQS